MLPIMIPSLGQDIFRISLDILLGKQGSHEKLIESYFRRREQYEGSLQAKDGAPDSQKG